MSSLDSQNFSEVLPEPVGVLVDAEGTVVAVSQSAVGLVDQEAGELCGRPFHELFAGAPPNLSAPSGLAQLRHGSGRPAPVRCRVLPLAGSPHRLILLATPETVNETELGSTLLRALFAQDRIGFVVRDCDLRVRAANASTFMPLLPAGSSLTEVIASGEAAEAEAALQQVLRTGVPLVAQEQYVRTLSHPVQGWSLCVSALRLADRSGHPTGVAVLLTDATAQQLSAQRLQLRHMAALSVGHSLDVRQTARELADLLAPGFGTLVAVDLAEAVLEGEEPPRSFGGGNLHLRRTAVRSQSGEWPLLPLGGALPDIPDSPEIRYLQEGHTVVMDRISMERRIAHVSQYSLFIPDDGRWQAVAPMAARGRVLGAITVWRTDQDDPFSEEDAELLSEIAAHGALGVDNARRYTREHRAAAELQRRLLPRGPMRTAVMETSGMYQPAGGGANIGGDWFDAIPLPSLRVALVVGDVIGHGLHASATMGRLRTAVQTLADMELPPDEILTRLDDLVARLAEEADPAHRDTIGGTCLVAQYDPVTEECVLASAGHPPPIAVTVQGTARTVRLCPGPPLGIGGLPFETTTIRLEPGSMLALFTDGLLDSGASDVDTALERLAEMFAACQASQDPLEETARRLTLRRDTAADDAALLLVRTHPLDPEAVAQWTFPADLSAVADARSAALGKLAEWGLNDVAFATELIVSELVTNAMRYAGGPVGLRLVRDQVLICEVSDPGSTQPRLRRALTTDEGGRGLFLVAQLSLRWGSRYTATGKTIWAEQELTN